MTLYQLGEYNTKTDLSEQSKVIRDYVISHNDYESINKLINSFGFLEEESVIILKRAILAGYWTSYYGFNWTPKQEIDFWELVFSKNQKSGVAILTLAESYRGHKIKTLKEVIDLYFKAIEINSEHYYSLMPEDLELLRTDNELKYRFIKIELDNYEKIWNRADFEEEYPYLIERCKEDSKMIDYVKNRIDNILKDK